MTVTQILKSIEKLTPDEMLSVRCAIDERLATRAGDDEASEDEFERELYEEGFLLAIPDRRGATPDEERPAPVDIKGKPLSETIIEERR